MISLSKNGSRYQVPAVRGLIDSFEMPEENNYKLPFFSTVSSASTGSVYSNAG
jgi:hypothetical protein